MRERERLLSGLKGERGKSAECETKTKRAIDRKREREWVRGLTITEDDDVLNDVAVQR